MFHFSIRCLDWDWYVRSTIDFDTGKWTATYAVSSGFTPTGLDGPLENLDNLPLPYPSVVAHASDRADPEHAKYGGKMMARSLILEEVWDRSNPRWESRDLSWTAQSTG
jgi:hypothetical protein